MIKRIISKLYNIILIIFYCFQFSFCKKFVLDNINYHKSLSMSDEYVSAYGLMVYEDKVHEFNFNQHLSIMDISCFKKDMICFIAIGRIHDYHIDTGNDLIVHQDFLQVTEWKNSERVVAKTLLNCGEQVWIFDEVSESVSVTYIPHLEEADLYPELCGKMDKEKLHGHFAENMEGFEILNKKKKYIFFSN
jgi:hypothetical protein